MGQKGLGDREGHVDPFQITPLGDDIAVAQDDPGRSTARAQLANRTGKRLEGPGQRHHHGKVAHINALPALARRGLVGDSEING